MDKKCVVSGMRPTGPLHLGHLVGALQSWVSLQDRYNTYFLIASLHALTTEYADSSKIRPFTREILMVWLSVGIDPEKSVIFDHAHVPGHSLGVASQGRESPFLHWSQTFPLPRKLLGF